MPNQVIVLNKKKEKKEVVPVHLENSSPVLDRDGANMK